MVHRLMTLDSPTAESLTTGLSCLTYMDPNLSAKMAWQIVDTILVWFVAFRVPKNNKDFFFDLLHLCGDGLRECDIVRVRQLMARCLSDSLSPTTPKFLRNQAEESRNIFVHPLKTGRRNTGGYAGEKS